MPCGYLWYWYIELTKNSWESYWTYWKLVLHDVSMDHHKSFVKIHTVEKRLWGDDD